MTPCPPPSPSPAAPGPGDPARAEAPWLARLQALRAAGLAVRDPIGLGFAEALAAQLGRQGGALQGLLRQRLEQALVALERGPAAAPKPPPDAVDNGLATPGAPGLDALRALNHALRGAGDPAAGGAGAPAAAAGREGAVERAGVAPGGLRSVAGFRESWVRLRAETRVSQALGRKPENAGPLNSHMLLLRSLDLMRSLSPDYLRRFVTHVDALLWLDQASQKPPAGKAGSRTAAKAGTKAAAKAGTKPGTKPGIQAGAKASTQDISKESTPAGRAPAAAAGAAARRRRAPS